jgi:hypothetical protein
MKHGNFVEAFGELSIQAAFLSRAASSNPAMAGRLYIFTEPSVIQPGRLSGAATDGRRLHIVDPLSCSEEDDAWMAAGFWRHLKTDGHFSWLAKVGDGELSFPDYRKVIPAEEPLFTLTLDCLPFQKRHGDEMWPLVKFFREFPEPAAINLDFLKDLDCGQKWNVKWHGRGKPVLFESGAYTAVIMPLPKEAR